MNHNANHWRLGAALGMAVSLALPTPSRADDTTQPATAPVAQLQAQDEVAIIGDSITEQKLYSTFMEDYLVMCQPAAELKAFNVGWSGEKAPQFQARMQMDCLTLGPTVATTCYGMNDGGYSAQTPEKADAYLKAQKAIVEKLKAAGVRLIVLGSPGVVDSHSFHKGGVSGAEYNPTLADERDIDKKLASDEGVVFADVYDQLLDVMTRAKAKYGDDFPVAGARDGIHPDRDGHLVMAYVFLKALGCSGDIGTITVHLDSNTASATDGHKIVSDDAGTIVVQSSRYPFCFWGDPTDANSTASVLQFLPFNDDLNRFMLVVTGGTAAKYKVTWGDSSKVYSADQLSHGINLAAEFPDNPFVEPFKAVEGAIYKKQAFDVAMTKMGLNSLQTVPTDTPATKDAVEDMMDAYAQAERMLGKSIAEQVKPVTHTIKVEPVPDGQ